jgi:predicted negative regulator of RcsB-dependent stress response
LKRLAEADPSNAQWQRDLSLIYERVGDVLKTQGELEAALSSHQDSLAIRKRLAEADPSNAWWQRELSTSYDKIGDVLIAKGKLVGAFASYQDSLAIRK